MAARREQLSLGDIARRAGVSAATASRAINNAYGVAPATRERVLRVAALADYVVSPEASSLARGKTQRVGLLVPHVERWFFGATVAAIESVLSEAGLDMLLYHVDGPADRAQFFSRLPVRRKVDGLTIVSLGIARSDRARLNRMGVSVVAIGNATTGYPSVGIDEELAGRQAVEHLIKLGHRRIGMIETFDRDFDYRLSRPERSTGYDAALAAAGIARDDSLVARVPWGGPHGADAMDTLLDRPDPPTAVFAHSDEIAIGAMRSIWRRGLRVPEDISLIGIDDHPHAELVDLTTVRQPVREQATIAATRMLDLLKGTRVPRSTTLHTECVVRRSTGPPAARIRDRSRS